VALGPMVHSINVELTPDSGCQDCNVVLWTVVDALERLGVEHTISAPQQEHDLVRWGGITAPVSRELTVHMTAELWHGDHSVPVLVPNVRFSVLERPSAPAELAHCLADSPLLLGTKTLEVDLGIPLPQRYFKAHSRADVLAQGTVTANRLDQVDAALHVSRVMARRSGLECEFPFGYDNGSFPLSSSAPDDAAPEVNPAIMQRSTLLRSQAPAFSSTEETAAAPTGEPVITPGPPRPPPPPDGRDAKLPHVTDWDVILPRVTDRDVSLPRVKDRDVSLPHVTDWDVSLPRVTDRDVSLPRVKDRDVRPIVRPSLGALRPALSKGKHPPRLPKMVSWHRSVATSFAPPGRPPGWPVLEDEKDLSPRFKKFPSFPLNLLRPLYRMCLRVCGHFVIDGALATTLLLSEQHNGQRA